jgi:hypothetical protein
LENNPSAFFASFSWCFHCNFSRDHDQLYKKFHTAGHFHVLFFLPTAPRIMMANDAQEETRCDAKRRVQQFIKGTIEMKNDERFKGLMELMLPGVQQIQNALYDLPTDTQVMYEDTLSRVIYDSANHHYSNTIPHDHCPLLLLVSGVTSISDTFGVCEAYKKKLHSIFHPIIYAAMTGCSKSRCKACDNLKKGSTKHALLVSFTYLVLSILFWNNPITNRCNPGSDLLNKFVKIFLGLKRQYSGGDACICPF